MQKYAVLNAKYAEVYILNILHLYALPLEAAQCQAAWQVFGCTVTPTAVCTANQSLVRVDRDSDGRLSQSRMLS